jgi:hypothetical protein
MPIPGMTGGDQKPILKYNAKAAKWKMDDVLLNSVAMAVDMNNAEAGWALFREGSAPDFQMLSVMDLAGGKKPYLPRPSPDHRKGFRVPVMLPDKLAAGKANVREFASCASAVCRSFDNLYDAWVLERKEHPGQIPVVTCKTYEEVETKHGSNFAPNFVITSWIDRPAGFDRPNGGAPAHVVDVPGEPEAIDPPEDFTEVDADSFGAAA